MAIQALTEAEFDQTLAQHDTVVIDFWAKWCGPCQAFKEVMEIVAQRYPNVYFAAVDIDQEKQLADDFDIRSVPFVMIARYQTVVYAEAGLLAESNLVELIEQALALTKDKLSS